jgi:hypothetical protein
LRSNFQQLAVKGSGNAGEIANIAIFPVNGSGNFVSRATIEVDGGFKG